jgi:hypothetical protein
MVRASSGTKVSRGDPSDLRYTFWMAPWPGLLFGVILQAPQRLHVDVRAPGDTMTVFHPPTDTSPVERVIRWFFSVPQWVQLTGAVLAVVLAIVAVVLVWQNAGTLRVWSREQHLSTPLLWKAVVGVQALLVLTVMAGAGTAFFVYSQNNN